MQSIQGRFWVNATLTLLNLIFCLYLVAVKVTNNNLLATCIVAAIAMIALMVVLSNKK